MQTACNLTVRFRWEVDAGHNHPEHTFTCAQDVDMAASAARAAAVTAPRGIRLVGADVSETGGRHGPWVPVDAALLISQVETIAAQQLPRYYSGPSGFVPDHSRAPGPVETPY